MCKVLSDKSECSSSCNKFTDRPPQASFSRICLSFAFVNSWLRVSVPIVNTPPLVDSASAG